MMNSELKRNYDRIFISRFFLFGKALYGQALHMVSEPGFKTETWA
jgi:hypothetical protein